MKLKSMEQRAEISEKYLELLSEFSLLVTAMAVITAVVFILPSISLHSL